MDIVKEIYDESGTIIGKTRKNLEGFANKYIRQKWEKKEGERSDKEIEIGFYEGVPHRAWDKSYHKLREEMNKYVSEIASNEKEVSFLIDKIFKKMYFDKKEIGEHKLEYCSVYNVKTDTAIELASSEKKLKNLLLEHYREK